MFGIKFALINAVFEQWTPRACIAEQCLPNFLIHHCKSQPVWWHFKGSFSGGKKKKVMTYKLSNICQFHYFRVNPKNWSPLGFKTSRASRCNVLVLSLVLKSISHFKGTVSIFDCLELALLAKKDVFPYF